MNGYDSSLNGRLNQEEPEEQVRNLQEGEQELAVTKLLVSRMNREDCLGLGEREAVAYRVAEIMTTAKSLYLEMLPSIIDVKEEKAQDSLFDELAGMRMVLIRMRDLIGEFDDAFMEAMASQRRADGNEETLPSPEEVDE